MPKLTVEQKAELVREAYDELQDAVEEFNTAILKFKKKFDPDSVGLNEWMEHNEDVMFDISTDIDSAFGDEEW